MPTTITGEHGVSKCAPASVEQGDLTWVPPYTKEFVGPWESVASAQRSYAHGLGAVPKQVVVELMCVTAEAGYSVGDIIENTGVQYSSASGTTFVRGYTQWRNATHCGLSISVYNGASFTVHRKDAAGEISLTNAYWNIRVRALA